MIYDLPGGTHFLIPGANADADTTEAIGKAFADGAISVFRRIDEALRPKDK